MEDWRNEVLFTGKKDEDKGKEYKWVLWVFYSTSDLPQLLVPVLVMSHAGVREMRNTRTVVLVVSHDMSMSRRV
jgi:hypothetical protein